jgi:hypothetical protein
MEYIVQALQTWATKNMIEVKNEGEEKHQQHEQSQESQGAQEKQLNSFLDITYGGEEEEMEEINLSQNVVTTRSSSKNISSNTPKHFQSYYNYHFQYQENLISYQPRLLPTFLK